MNAGAIYHAIIAKLQQDGLNTTAAFLKAKLARKSVMETIAKFVPEVASIQSDGETDTSPALVPLGVEAVCYVTSCCGRLTLFIGGVPVAMETDVCRWSKISDRAWNGGSLKKAASVIQAALLAATHSNGDAQVAEQLAAIQAHQRESREHAEQDQTSFSQPAEKPAAPTVFTAEDYDRVIGEPLATSTPLTPDGVTPCDMCDGTGVVEEYPPGHLASSWDGAGNAVTMEGPCNNCGGTGELIEPKYPEASDAPRWPVEDRSLLEAVAAGEVACWVRDRNVPGFSPIFRSASEQLDYVRRVVRWHLARRRAAQLTAGENSIDAACRLLGQTLDEENCARIEHLGVMVTRAAKLTAGCTCGSGHDPDCPSSHDAPPAAKE